MASRDMIQMADGIIRQHLREQCQRLIDAGFPDAAIVGNYGTDADDEVWCNVNLTGLGGNGMPWQGRRCSLAELEDDISEALAEVPLRNKRVSVADKIHAYVSRANSEQLAELETKLS